MVRPTSEARADEAADRDERLGEAIEAYLTLAEAGQAARGLGPSRRGIPTSRRTCSPPRGPGPGPRPGGRAVRAGAPARVGTSRRRLSDRPRAGPRRDGDRLRGGPRRARPARRAEGPRVVRRRPTRAGGGGSSTRRKTAAGLHHTHIVPVFDVGQVGGLCYYAMQRIEGSGPRPRHQAPEARPDGRRRLDAIRAGPPLEPGRADGARPLGHGRCSASRRRPGAPGRRKLAGPGPPRRGADAVRAAARVGLLSLGRRRRPAGGRGAGPRPPARGDPPRRQAVEPAGRRPRRRLDGRLRPGPAAGRPEPDADRQPARHAAVHEPRAGEDRPDRRPERRLQPRRDALRAAHPPPAVRGEDGGRADRPDRRPRPGLDPRDRPAGAARPGDDRPQGPAQARRRPLRLGRRAVRRPRAVPQPRAGPGPADRPARPRLAGGAAAPVADGRLGGGDGRRPGHGVLRLRPRGARARPEGGHRGPAGEDESAARGGQPQDPRGAVRPAPPERGGAAALRLGREA